MYLVLLPYSQNRKCSKPVMTYFFADKMAKGNVELLDLPTEESDLMKITPLGSGQEVGRSCHIVQFKVNK